MSEYNAYHTCGGCDKKSGLKISTSRWKRCMIIGKGVIQVARPTDDRW